MKCFVNKANESESVDSVVTRVPENMSRQHQSPNRPQGGDIYQRNNVKITQPDSSCARQYVYKYTHRYMYTHNCFFVIPIIVI